ncbi:metabotropic glutamate receptor-like protein R [Condylostylus longicornis]|uniref:metabotropic glutamate receptor-like protein R n=1 Tax=Condylostylus longicornis TaxID=2530218 RepID=UPI00244DDEDE|nr:metabotropic glutamate receptor-like protein R [Condylostylus longicornis]
MTLILLTVTFNNNTNSNDSNNNDSNNNINSNNTDNHMNKNTNNNNMTKKAVEAGGSNEIFSQMHKDDKIVVLGDFNRSALSFTIDEYDNHLLPVNIMEDIDFNLVSTFYGNDLQQVVRYPNERGNWLDLAFSNAYDSIWVRLASDEESLFKNSIHHNAIVLEFPNNKLKFSKSYNKEIVYDFLNADYNGINYALSLINWNDMFHQHNLGDIVSDFYSILFRIIDAHVPRILKKDRLAEQWLDRKLRQLHNRRNKLHNKIKHSGTITHLLMNIMSWRMNSKKNPMRHMIFISKI